MAGNFEFHFEWDAAKADNNQRKHGISFGLATTIFQDPLLISIPDTEHSETEERWITMGHAKNSKLLLVVHTYLPKAFGSNVNKSVPFTVPFTL